MPAFSCVLKAGAITAAMGSVSGPPPQTIDGDERGFGTKVVNANQGKAKYTTMKLPAGDVLDGALIASAACFDSESLDFGFTVLNSEAH